LNLGLGLHTHQSPPDSLQIALNNSAILPCLIFSPQAALPNEGAVLRVFFGLWVSGQMKLRRIKGYRDIGGKEKAAA
jgi:hypothetical protein